MRYQKNCGKLFKTSIALQKEQTNALSLLNQAYTKRLEVMMKGPECHMNLKKNISAIKNMMKLKIIPC